MLVERTYSGEMPARVGESEWLDPERAVEGSAAARGAAAGSSLLPGLEFAGRVVRGAAARI